MGDSSIQVRRPRFDVESGAGGLWNPKMPELSHTLNAFQLALPYLEPYFIDAVKQAMVGIRDPKLAADAQAFCAQEANHAREHKRYCRFLQKRYPRLKEFETAIQQSLLRSRKQDPLEWRLAYTAGYEVITAQVARWLFRRGPEWFDGADQGLAQLMTWHAAEEIEHRSVAYDVLQTVNRSWWLRFKGVVGAFAKTYVDMTSVVTYMLKVDGLADKPESRARRMKLRKEILMELAPALIRYLMPGYHPSKEAEPAGYAAWLRDHAYDVGPVRGVA
ncbi:MAG: metal-dependent hydrolase [Polyangiales bacterium]